jgi:SpoVK/Ycf46/Vps4 family AAA+-type ATPase
MDLTKNELTKDFIQLARTALSGRIQDIQLVIHRASRRYRSSFPEMSDALISLLQESPTRVSPLRKQNDVPIPVDLDSRLQLLRVENGFIDHEPIFSDEIQLILNQILLERKNAKALLEFGLYPTKSLLFTGPPGVGKTLAAKWIASKLERPLLVLDLAAVMSSFLGRTGNNIRFVLDYAKKTDCVLLLDEFDAIAKRRDDNSEIGELKRLVTVLLQEIDDWPPTGLLLAATNHPDLLDPAVWRRFEALVRFQNPTRPQIEQQIDGLLETQINNHGLWSKILSYVFNGKSFSDVERQINLIRKSSAIAGRSLQDSVQSLIIGADLNLTHEQRVELACILNDSGIISQRRTQELTGIARETIRKHRTKTGHAPEIKSPLRKVTRKQETKVRARKAVLKNG